LQVGRVFEFPSQRIQTMELTSLLLTYVKIYGTVARVISNKPRQVFSLDLLHFLYLLYFLPLAASLHLFALFSAPQPFVFNNFQPLFPKHPGWGYPRMRLRDRRPVFLSALRASVANPVPAQVI
jgi:hypothetical protein